MAATLTPRAQDTAALTKAPPSRAATTAATITVTAVLPLDGTGTAVDTAAPTELTMLLLVVDIILRKEVVYC